MSEKLGTLLEIEGYEDENDLIEKIGFSSLVPGICMNPGCDYTTMVEPDQWKGWCEMCDTKTVNSAINLIM